MITIQEPKTWEWEELIGKRVYVEFVLLEGEKTPFKTANLIDVFHTSEIVMFESETSNEPIIATFQAIKSISLAE